MLPNCEVLPRALPGVGTLSCTGLSLLPAVSARSPGLGSRHSAPACSSQAPLGICGAHLPLPQPLSRPLPNLGAASLCLCPGDSEASRCTWVRSEATRDPDVSLCLCAPGLSMARAPNAREGCQLGERRGLRSQDLGGKVGGRSGNIKQARRSAAGCRGWGTVGEEHWRTHIGPRRAGRVVSTMGLWPGTVSEVPGLFVPQQEIWVHTFPLGIELAMMGHLCPPGPLVITPPTWNGECPGTFSDAQGPSRPCHQLHDLGL